MIFNEMLKEYREEKGLSTDEFAKKIKIKKEYLEDIENGKRCMSFARLDSIHKILGTKKYYVFLYELAKQRNEIPPKIKENLLDDFWLFRYVRKDEK